MWQRSGERGTAAVCRASEELTSTSDSWSPMKGEKKRQREEKSGGEKEKIRLEVEDMVLGGSRSGSVS